MRTFPLFTLFILAITWLAHPASAAPSSAALDFTAVDSYVTAQMQAVRIPGVALAIVQDDQIVHLQGYGVADPSGRPVTPQTPFLIASTVKPFTALAIMQLVEAGRVELDAPVQRYLPWFRLADAAASAQITVHHLLNHTSDLSEATGNEIPVSAGVSDTALEQRVRRLSAAQLNRPVGARFEYGGRYQDTMPLNVSPNTLAAMQQPAVCSYNDATFYGLGWMGAILIVSLLFAVGVVRSLLKLSRRPATPQERRQGWRALIAPIGLPLAVAAGWALLLLLGLPQVAGRSLPFLLLYVPDLGYMLIASAALAFAWGFISIFVSLTDLTRNDRFSLNRGT